MNKRTGRGLTSKVIGSVIGLLLLFSIAVDIIGYARFHNTFVKEYNDYAFRTAKTASIIIKADNIDHYIEVGGDDEEYQNTKKYLHILCDEMDVAMIYIIKPDSDYKHFVSVFNILNKNSPYDEWEVGYYRETTNEEYEKRYKEIYEDGLERATIDRTRNLNGGLPHITSLIPLKDSNGNVAAILCVQRNFDTLWSVQRIYLFWISVTTGIFMIVSIIFVTYGLRRQVINPIKKISEEAARFASDDKKSAGDFANRVSNIKEINVLARSIDKMEKDTVDYIDNLTTITKDKERIGTELRLASKIQDDSLPNIFPAFPEKKEFDIYATMSPAKEVGGDFYDFFLIDENHLGLVIADVSGKGIPGALFMMVTKILVNEQSEQGLSPAEIVSAINKKICDNNRSQMFVTMWIGILDINTGNLTFANAGHDDAAICKNGGNFEFMKTRHGLPVGVRKKSKYENFETQLEKGERIYLYTDGVPEATNSSEEMFGLDRMLESLNSVKDSSLEEMLQKITDDTNAFVGDAVQFDDMTMLCMRYNGKEVTP